MTGVSRVALTTFADIPAGTGLGSSGAFSCALMKALCVYARQALPDEPLARLASRLEVLAGVEGGLQDQYTSAVGGILGITLGEDDWVHVDPLTLTPTTLATLEERLSLWYLGTRDSTPLQQAQIAGVEGGDDAMLSGLHKAKDLGVQARLSLESGDTPTFAQLLHEQYIAKRDRSPGTTPEWVDTLYRQSCKYGSRGGKIIGAGGGGFLMLYAENPEKLHAFMEGQGLAPTRFRFDFEGTKVVSG